MGLSGPTLAALLGCGGKVKEGPLYQEYEQFHLRVPETAGLCLGSDANPPPDGFVRGNVQLWLAVRTDPPRIVPCFEPHDRMLLARVSDSFSPLRVLGPLPPEPSITPLPPRQFDMAIDSDELSPMEARALGGSEFVTPLSGDERTAYVYDDHVSSVAFIFKDAVVYMSCGRDCPRPTAIELAYQVQDWLSRHSEDK